MITLANLKKLCKISTPGPWHFDCGNGEVESEDEKHLRITVAHRNDLMKRINHCERFQLGYNPPFFPVDPDIDMEFIAESREAVPLLIEEVEKLREALEQINRADYLNIYDDNGAFIEALYASGMAGRALAQSKERLP